MSDRVENLALLNEAIFYHGTSAASWDADSAGCDGGLYMTINRSDAETYAEEAAMAENTEAGNEEAQAILVTITAEDVRRLLDAGCSIEPDWGWINGLKPSETVPGWEESFAAVGTIHLGGFCHEHKAGLPTRAAFEGHGVPSVVPFAVMA